jgi:hypothetical protein
VQRQLADELVLDAPDNFAGDQEFTRIGGQESHTAKTTPDLMISCRTISRSISRVKLLRDDSRGGEVSSRRASISCSNYRVDFVVWRMRRRPVARRG